MKKTIYASLMAFLILMGCTKAYNDLKVNPGETQLKSPPSNYTESHTGTFFNGDVPLVCDGITTDHLSGNLEWHCTMHYVDGILENMSMTYRGTLTSEITDEVFIIKETANWNHPHEGILTYQKNIRGDKGSHILIFGFVNLDTWENTIEKTICQPN